MKEGFAGAAGFPRVPAHEATTRHLGAAYPLLAESGLAHRGVVIGRDLLGATFAYDPFELYAAGVLTNPNMLVFGQLGRGKSAFVKTYLWRQAVFGRHAWVVDPKGEYRALACAWGLQPVALRPGGTVRLNPLDPAPGEATGGGDRGVGEQRRLELLAALAVACLHRELRPQERAALDVALAEAVVRTAGVPTVPAVAEALFDPTPAAAGELHTGRSALAQDGREVALELRRLVHGDLRGMFDGPTTPGIRLDAPLVLLDLSAVYGSAALGILMACATSWLQSALGRDRHPRVLVVVDEAWAILSNLGVARWLQASWKLSRAYGVANMAVLHRLSDLQAVGAAGSEQVGLARGLLADSETRVLYAQSPGEVAVAAEMLGLSSTEAELVPQLGRGVALWKVGQRSFLVQHRLAAGERALVDTDGAMTDRRDGVQEP